MNKKNSQGTITIETMTETSIADIPATLALEAQGQWKTIRHTQLIEHLTKFRVKVEAEAGIGIANIETNLGLALADVTEALGIKDPDDLLQVLGDNAYLQAYVNPIPYQISQQERFKQEDRAGPRLLAKLKNPTFWKRLDQLRQKWHKKQRKAELEPSTAR